MARDVFGEMLVQLKFINRLLVAQLRGQMRQQELVALLATTGATIKEIAEVLDTTPATVQTTLTRVRKRSAEPALSGKKKQQRQLPGPDDGPD